MTGLRFTDLWITTTGSISPGTPPITSTMFMRLDHGERAAQFPGAGMPHGAGTQRTVRKSISDPMPRWESAAARGEVMGGHAP